MAGLLPGKGSPFFLLAVRVLKTAMGLCILSGPDKKVPSKLCLPMEGEQSAGPIGTPCALYGLATVAQGKKPFSGEESDALLPEVKEKACLGRKRERKNGK